MIVIYAPFPSPERVRGGWMGRIAAIERLFVDRERVYVYPGDPAHAGNPRDYRVHVGDVAPKAKFAWLDFRFSNHHRWLSQRIDEAEFVYAHTCHSSHHLLPYYRTGKIVTDLHGIAPEEEELQGNPDRARFFGGLEEDMIRGSAALVTVTEAMIDHFRGKYPGMSTPSIRLPIVDIARGQVRLERPARSKPRVVYAGGTQSWQKIDRMMAAIARGRDRFEFELWTDSIPAMRAAAERAGVIDVVRIGTAAPEQLPVIYGDADYGFVLRDDIAVNRVACPTKLSEYLAFGVVPIVQLESLGDFLQLGYRGVRVEDFEAGRLPAADELLQLRRRNAAAFAALEREFQLGSQRLRELQPAVARESMRKKASVFQCAHERAAFYPVRWGGVTLDRASGRQSLPWPEEVGPVVDRTLSIPAGDAVQGIELKLAFPPFLTTPVQVDCIDADGRSHAVTLTGDHDVDAYGNWLFGRGGTLRATPAPGALPTQLRIRFEFVLVGPEALVAAASSPAPPARPLRQLAQRVRALLRRRR